MQQQMTKSTTKTTNHIEETKAKHQRNEELLAKADELIEEIDELVEEAVVETELEIIMHYDYLLYGHKYVDMPCGCGGY